MLKPDHTRSAKYAAETLHKKTRRTSAPLNADKTVSANNLLRTVMALCTILLITSIAFYPSLRNGFPNWDDTAYLTENPAIKELSWQTMKLMFTSFYVACYLPLTILSYAVEYHFFNLEPFIYHATNLALHLLNSLLVFWLVFTLRKSFMISITVALLFGIHPLHVESVAWVSERKDVLSTVFFVGALIAYLYYQEKQASIYYYISLTVFILSLLSKAITISLPFILLLCDYYNQRRFDRGVVLDKIPFFICAIGFGAIAVFAQHSYGGIRQTQLPDFFHNLVIAGYGLVFYLIKLIAPVNLSCLYPYPARVGSLLPFSYYAACLLAIVLIAVVIVSARRSRSATLGSLFFLITILPVLQLIPTGQAMAADRYTYIPSIGIFFLAGEICSWLYWRPVPYARTLKTVFLIIALVTVAALSLLTWQRCHVWKNGITLWSDVIQKYPDEPVAYNNRGLAYKESGEYDRAIADYTVAVKINPQFADAYNNRGIAYQLKIDYDRSIADYREALQIKPRYAKAYSNRGLAYSLKGDHEKAIADCTRAITIDPQFATAYYNRGNAYAALGEDTKAIVDYTQALSLQPYDAEVYNNRANLYLKKKEYNQAIDDYNRALNSNPQYAIACYNRAVAYYEKGDYARAWQDVKRLQAIGFPIRQDFLKQLQSASGRKGAQ